MSDVNVVIQAVDSAMDIMEAFSKEVHDIRAHGIFCIDETVDSVRYEKETAENQQRDFEYRRSFDEDGNDVHEYEALVKRCEALQELYVQCSSKGSDLKNDWCRLCISVVNCAQEAKRCMGEYITKLNKICISSDGNSGQNNGSKPYHVVIVDSKRYPQTAEHIKRAQSMGFPEVVSLGRSDAADRRKASLANVRRSSIYDRDEWPMAVFREGGAQANVVYVDGADNRGAGSSISWQMRGLSDGTSVRVRVI